MTAPSPLTPELAAALHGASAARFLATRDRGGQPHLVPALSAQAAEDGHIRFAAILPQQTLNDLEANDECALLVVDQDLRWWTLSTRFSGFVDSEGNEKIKRWGRLEVEAVEACDRYRRLRLAVEYGWAGKLGIPKGDDYADTLPRDLARKLATLKAVKGIAYINEDERVTALPCMSLVPAGPGALVCPTKTAPLLQRIPEQTAVAVCLLTFAPSAHQIVGVWEGMGGGFFRTHATIRVRDVLPALA